MAGSPDDQSSRSRCGLFRFAYDKNKDNREDIRNILLIVATLIATVTFQAGVTPPGGVWQQDDEKKQSFKAGEAVYSRKKVPFYAFLISNTFAFSTSIVFLLSLTYGLPFHIELWASILALFVTYVASLFAIVPHNDDFKFRFLIATALLPFGIRMLVQIFKWLRRNRGSVPET